MKKLVVLGAYLFSATSGMAYEDGKIYIRNQSSQNLMFAIRPTSGATGEQTNSACLAPNASSDGLHPPMPKTTAYEIWVHTCMPNDMTGRPEANWVSTGASGTITGGVYHIWDCSNYCQLNPQTPAPAKAMMKKR